MSSELFYVRNHLPVPVIVGNDYELTVEVDASDGGDSPAAERTLSLAELQALPKHSVTVTIMCGGNRRSEMHAVRPVRGLHWGRAAVGTAEWSGARLCDVLAAMGVQSDDRRHVHVSKGIVTKVESLRKTSTVGQMCTFIYICDK